MQFEYTERTLWMLEIDKSPRRDWLSLTVKKLSHYKGTMSELFLIEAGRPSWNSQEAMRESKEEKMFRDFGPSVMWWLLGGKQQL